jgi:pimeloyl-ACP methyl ester carboxylesterase
MTSRLESRSWNREPIKLLLIVACIALAGGCVTQRTTNQGFSRAGLSLNHARKTRSNPSIAAGYYLDAADTSLHSINSTSSASTESRLTYNSACQELTTLLQSNPERWNRTETIRTQSHIYRLHFAPGSKQAGIWAPNYFDFLRTPQQVHAKPSDDPRNADGWGGTLVGVHKPLEPRKYFLPRLGLALPVTAVVDIPRPTPNQEKVLDATLELYSPGRRATVQLAGLERPLSGDLVAPIAYYRNPFLLGIQAMLRPEILQDRTGLYLIEPYDPDKVPVLFIHGLLSIPQMWAPTINAINADPELRGRFQFWVFAYPTGDPILLSAKRLRESLAQIYQLYPRTKGMILIGHSMGGLLAQVQVVDPGRTLWNAVFKKDADRLYNLTPADDLAKEALIFGPNPHVKRVVFICVPHRGSSLATNWIGSLGVGLIRLPKTILRNVSDELTAPLLQSLGLKHLPTGINGLSPRSPVLRALDTLPITAPYYSIIGDRGRGDATNSSDGVVPYWSSHLAGAQSELIVPGPHGSFALPQTIDELKRILRLHLASLDHSYPKNRAFVIRQRVGNALTHLVK